MRLTSCGGPTRWNTLLEEKGGECCGTGSGEDIKPALIGWASEVLLWLRRLEHWLEANVFVKVFPVPGSRATTILINSTTILSRPQQPLLLRVITSYKNINLAKCVLLIAYKLLKTGLSDNEPWGGPSLASVQDSCSPQIILSLGSPEVINIAVSFHTYMTCIKWKITFFFHVQYITIVNSLANSHCWFVDQQIKWFIVHWYQLTATVNKCLRFFSN